MQDNKIEKINNNNYTMILYLDHNNKRVRMDDYQGNINLIIEECEKITKHYQAEKLIIKARREHFIRLVEGGFRFEGAIDRYFLGSDCLFFSKYYTQERKTNIHWVTEDEIVANVRLMERKSEVSIPPPEYQLKLIKEGDAVILAQLYQKVFKIYPTPLDDPDYIKNTMKEGTIYFGFWYKDEIVSAASAEVNQFYRNAELTDCATLKEHRKHGLMKVLLIRLENELKNQGIYCSYSIARSLSFGMNAVFHQLGYSYRGRLINNCFIYDKLEDMNLWVKDLTND
jgi:beta-lysine N6-acetyltransferase